MFVKYVVAWQPEPVPEGNLSPDAAQVRARHTRAHALPWQYSNVLPEARLKKTLSGYKDRRGNTPFTFLRVQI